MGPSTRAVHAGLPAAQQGATLLPGPVPAAPFHLQGAADAGAILLRARRQPDLVGGGGGARGAGGRRERPLFLGHGSDMRSWGTDALPDGFMRFSARCEDIADLRADMAQALEKS